MTKHLNGRFYRLAVELCGLLADTYVIQKTIRAAHFNASDSSSPELPDILDRQYEELHGAIDTLAERLRELGIYSPGTLDDYLALSHLPLSTTRGVPLLLKRLVEDHHRILRRIRDLHELARQSGDRATAAMLSRRQRVHELNARSLESLIMRAMHDHAGRTAMDAIPTPTGREATRQRVSS